MSNNQIKNKKTYSGEVLNYKKDGTPFWNELTLSPVFGKQGEVINYIGFQRDITERKEAERTKENGYKTQQLLNQILELSHSDIDLYNSRGIVRNLFNNIPRLELTH